MNFGQALGSVFANYATFRGRACRAEYWYFCLLTWLMAIAFGIIRAYDQQMGQLFQALWGLATLLPSVAVGARRLHDTNRSGWWLLLSAVPLIGWIFLLIWTVKRGDAGPNDYGDSPI